MKDISDMLTVKDATINSFIHENEYTGLKRSLFWNINITFKPEILNINGEDRTLRTSLSCEWIQIPVADYKSIKDFQFNKNYPSGIETSFYLHEHSFVDELSGLMSYEDAAFFNLDVKFKYHNNYAFDEGIIIQKKISTKLNYSGLIIVPSNLKMENNDLEKVKNAASEFINLNDYCEPSSEKGFRYDFKPKK